VPVPCEQAIWNHRLAGHDRRDRAGASGMTAEAMIGAVGMVRAGRRSGIGTAFKAYAENPIELARLKPAQTLMSRWAIRPMQKPRDICIDSMP
jgi:hypothetical protein